MLEHGMKAIREHLSKMPSSESQSIEDLRSAYDKAQYVFEPPEGVTVERIEAAGVAAEVLTPAQVAGQRTVLYLHGGGYALGSPSSHRHMVANLVHAAKAKALLIDYRRAPEHPFPAALDDALSAYRWLLDSGVAGDEIAIAGDSAGGGLAAATLVALREQGLALPMAGICISPWTDLTNSAASYETRAAADPMVTRASIVRWTEAYLGGNDPKTPLASPAHADLAGLPPLLIQVGGDEVLLDDAKLLAERAQGAGVNVTLEVWEGMIHVWHWFAEYLDEAARANARIAAFIEEHSA